MLSNLIDIHDLVLRFLFEKVPFLRLLDGYKTELGAFITALGAFLAALVSIFPQYAPLKEIYAQYTLYAGLVVNAIGQLHASAKDRAGVE
jgi:hypothetical protein